MRNRGEKCILGMSTVLLIGFSANERMKRKMVGKWIQKWKYILDLRYLGTHE
jgi:hypothetical protein